ncbi:enoyl-CoA hydratase-related protein [Sinimarinibacterium thermocellulolyticum]|uniref:Enoyl-CoA hydratase-related protein n=1 Tax=Sinimarinibacterium thermocellulolyticum TaxID=3170016 RepID=A0ABV2ADK4_9GAMM
MNDPSRIPVIVGIGEHIDRPQDLAQALEPLALMALALKAADADAGGQLLRRIESLDLVGLISWRYRDPVRELCGRLDIQPQAVSNASMGGETPVRLIHEAALRIARGELQCAAIVGGEAMHARINARKRNLTLPWTPLPPKEEAAQFASSRFEVSPVAQQLGVIDPAHIYPLYENAAQHTWGQSPATALDESARLWARYARVAADNPFAWIREAPSAEQIRTVDANNRLIAWPYPKLMVANPNVNQAAAVILTSLAFARKSGVDERNLVHIWGGASACESEDYLKRDRYDRSAAQAAVLRRATEIVGGSALVFGKLELYSCFPVVPKMALRELALDPDSIEPTVTGGLTFFGGPLNNYMTHAVCAMVRALRKGPAQPGLLYGQGGYVYKHHTLIIGMQPPPSPLAAEHSVQAQADAARGPAPEVVDRYSGPASIETYTVIYARDGLPLHGIVVLRTPDGRRTMAKVAPDDEAGMALLTSMGRNPIGSEGQVRIDPFGLPVWEPGPKRDRRRLPKRYALVEREGRLTVVTINRPETLNALHPAASAELAEIFDDFASDPDQWVAILTGAGDRAFCSGNDLKFTARAMARGEPFVHPLSGIGGLTRRFDLNKPVIAAVNGAALGGGFEIALACDLILASSKATFGLPEPKVGLAALEGGLLRLPQQIGLKRAMGMILSARVVSAEEGFALGFVNQVTSPDALMVEARRWASDILACSPMSIQASKEIVRRGMTESSTAEAIVHQLRYPAVRALFKSTDFREGPLAFAQKRAARWKGE